MSHHVSPGPVPYPVYAPVSSFTRCLHFHDYSSCYDRRALVPSRIRVNMTHTQAVGDVLWFSPSLWSTNEHNKYGNVSCFIDIADLVQRFGPENFYYVDKQEFIGRTSSRIVLSNKSPALTRVDTKSSGSPLLKDEWSGGWKYATHCTSGRFHQTVSHQLELAIEVDAEDCRWLYSTCRVEPNCHSLANSRGMRFDSNVCHRFNTFSMTCLYSLSRQEALLKLQAEYPRYNQK